MNLTIATDVLFDREPAPGELREAAARAFDVPPSAVAVGSLQNAAIEPGVQVVMQRQPENMPGDFPVWYGLTVVDSLLDRADHALDALVRQLGMTALSDARGQDEMMLHLPDGSGLVVHLHQDDDDSFRLTPVLKRTVAAARRRAGRGGCEPEGSTRAIAS